MVIQKNTVFEGKHCLNFLKYVDVHKDLSLLKYINSLLTLGAIQIKRDTLGGGGGGPTECHLNFFAS